MQMSPTKPVSSPNAFTLEEKIKYGIIGLVAVGSAFFIGRSIVRKLISRNEQKFTYDDDKPAAAAQKLKLAFENDNWMGWGTDEATIKNVIKGIRSKDEFDKVIKSYQKLYARSLMADMQDELDSEEYQEVVAMLSSKPDQFKEGAIQLPTATRYKAWAQRLQKAFNETNWGLPYGTDEAAIREVVAEIPTQAAFMETAHQYQLSYGEELISRMKSELSSAELKAINQQLANKPKA